MIYLASCRLFMPYVLFLYILLYLYLYHNLMVKVVSGRWCACVLVTLPLMCLSCRMPVLGQHPVDLVVQLLSFHHRHCHLRRP
jgi:hypothetical protein